MGKTGKEQKRKWMRINTARDYKTSHTEGMIFKAAGGRQYVVQANGSWKRAK